MTILCLPRPRDCTSRFLKTCAAARPSFKAVSAVTGSRFAVPRTPSVPKIFLGELMKFLDQCFGGGARTPMVSGRMLTTVTPEWTGKSTPISHAVGAEDFFGGTHEISRSMLWWRGQDADGFRPDADDGHAGGHGDVHTLFRGVDGAGVGQIHGGVNLIR